MSVPVVIGVGVLGALVGLGVGAARTAGDEEPTGAPQVTGPTSAPATTATTATLPTTDVRFTLPDLTIGGVPQDQPPTSSVLLTVPDLTIPVTIIVATDAADRIPAATEPPSGLGDDAELNDLAQRCHAGGLIACDVLFMHAAQDPDYEAYADTCAGRQGEGTSLFCARMVGFPDPDGDLSDVPADAPNGRQARACWAGDMAACDIVAKPGSDPIVADIGSSCGGRQDVGLGHCVTAFAEYAALLDP